MPYRVDLVTEPVPSFPVGDFPVVFAFRENAERCKRAVEARNGSVTVRTVRSMWFGKREERALLARPGGTEASPVHPGMQDEG